jgi:D-3-phosphoglycerate dehydrogenase
MKVVLAEAREFDAAALSLLRSLGEVVALDGEPGSLAASLRDAEVLFVRLRHRIDAALLSRAPQLKVIVSPTTGLDHIDLAAAERHGIAVLSLKGETAFLESVTATAELTWALILNLARPVAAAHASVMAGAWSRDLWKGRELKGKTLGIVGYGRLGRIVADYAQAFRMAVLVHDPKLRGVPPAVRQTTLEELLEQADIVTLHVPLEPGTIGLIGRAELERMRAGAWLINTSRGEVIDEAALLRSLQSGHLGGAALDVLSDEAKGQADWLARSDLARFAAASDRLIITPHIGGATRESMRDTEAFMARKLLAYLGGEGAASAAAPTNATRQV